MALSSVHLHISIVQCIPSWLVTCLIKLSNAQIQIIAIIFQWYRSPEKKDKVKHNDCVISYQIYVKSMDKRTCRKFMCTLQEDKRRTPNFVVYVILCNFRYVFVWISNGHKKVKTIYFMWGKLNILLNAYHIGLVLGSFVYKKG